MVAKISDWERGREFCEQCAGQKVKPEVDVEEEKEEALESVVVVILSRVQNKKE